MIRNISAPISTKVAGLLLVTYLLVCLFACLLVALLICDLINPHNILTTGTVPANNANAETVAAWVRSVFADSAVGVTYAGKFNTENIGGDILDSLTDQDLRELGMPMGDRKHFLKALKPGYIFSFSSPSLFSISLLLLHIQLAGGRGGASGR